MVQLTPPARIPALEAGKVDFLIATLAADARARQGGDVHESPTAPSRPGSTPRRARPSKAGTTSRASKVGVNRGSSVEREFTNREKELNLTILRFEDDATTMQALFSGQVDAIAEPDAQANAAIKARGDTETELKFVFRHAAELDDRAQGRLSSCSQWLNNLIYYVKQNGELDAISQKWVGSPLPELPTF